MRRYLPALLFLYAAPAAAQPTSLDAASSAPKLEAATQVEVDRIFADWGLSTHAPGMTYGIIANGRVMHVGGFGVQNLDDRQAVGPDSLFRIASMSKAFTALAILKLRDDGKLRLDEPAQTYVPELRGWKRPTSDSPLITVRDLLNHLAGFVEDNPWGDRQQVLTEAEFTALLRAGVPYSHATRTGMEYSNLGYAMLGRIISNVSGMPYQRYITRTIMAPLGMTSTTYDIFTSPKRRRVVGYAWRNNAWVREPDMRDGAFGAMGGVETTANDYAKWVAFLLSAWPARDDADFGPVRRSTVREIVTGSNFPFAEMRSPAVGGSPCRQAGAYGMGWDVLEDCDLGRIVTHTGAYPGYGSVVMLLPEKNVGIFAFSSRTYNAPVVPSYRAMFALQRTGLLKDANLPVMPGLAAAYEAARAVWRSGDIASAPLANNVLMDRSATDWAKLVADLKVEVGSCAASEPVLPISTMEGRFTWRCERGRVSGRVQLAPTPQATIQALHFASAAP